MVLTPQWRRRELGQYFDKYFNQFVALSDAVITPSEAVKQEVVQVLGIDSGKVHPIHHGVDHELFRPLEPAVLQDARRRLQLPESFLFFAGAMEPRKNLMTALKAYLSLSASFRRRFPFLIAGPEGWRNDDVRAIIADHSPHIRHIGYLGSLDLASAYNLARAVVYPSHYEGFGLPPLEAMACGTPAIVSDIPVMREVCGDAAVYVDPKNPDDIASEYQRICEDDKLRADFSVNGRSHAAGFQWDKSAAQHLRIFNSAG
jgi:glycosyltransferase involved in cell wall biosynthesis